MRNAISRALLVIVVFSFGCEGPAGPIGLTGPSGTPGEDTTLDNQIFIPFPNFSLKTSNTAWTLSNVIHTIPHFNIDNYVGVDSVIFGIGARVDFAADTGYFELFNLTDSVPISGGLLSSNSTQWIRIETGNIYGSLPHKEVTLSIRSRINFLGHNADAWTAYLILQR